MASATAAKTEPKDSLTSREASSIPGLILAAVLRHNKEDALNQRTEGKWHNIPAATFVERVKNVALGLSSAFLGLYLGWIGYVANQTQSAETIAGLKLLVTLVAGLGLVASFAVMYFYKLDAARHAQIVQEIERNAKERIPK